MGRAIVLFVCLALGACGRFGYDDAGLLGAAGDDGPAGDGDGGPTGGGGDGSPGSGDGDPITPATSICAAPQDAFVFCDDFEDDDTWWFVGAEAGIVDGSPDAYQGQGFGDGRSTEPYVAAYLGLNLPVTFDEGDRVVVRAYLFVPGGREFTGPVVELFGGTNFVGPKVVLSPDGRFGVGTQLAESHTGPALQADRWLCVELDAELSADAGRATLYVDGAMVAELTGQTLEEPIITLEVGVLFPDDEIGTVRVDELVIARAPVGCD